MTNKFVVFLDFDGVLHSYKDLRANLEFRLDILERLESFCETHHLDIVISSSWKHHHSLGQMKEYLTPVSPKRIIDITPILPVDHRAEEIGQWLRDNGEDIKGFVILDDVDEGLSEAFPKEFVKVDSNKALTGTEFTKMKEILGGHYAKK